MSKITFLFLVIFYLLLTLFAGGVSLSTFQEMQVCLFFVLILGIPHGAIDNILYLSKHKISKLRFYTIYLAIIALNVLFWLWLPSLALLSFLLLSAYHFGQSQFTNYFQKEPIGLAMFYIVWGIALLSGLVYFNIEATYQLLLTIDGLATPAKIQLTLATQWILIATASLTLLTLLFFGIKRYLPWEKILLEGILFLLMQVSFFLFPLLIGFTLYFIVLHSIKVLQDEYRYLIAQKIVRSLQNFVKLLLPLSLVSIVGVLLIFGLIYLQWIPISYVFAFLILISSITVPHAYVMKVFYKA
ncbi:MAG: Brp/Blh family beta-carotene 15,15'-dioxygenase [Thermonemataceae bacterium]